MRHVIFGAAILLGLLPHSSAHATQDMMGVYFDPQCNSTCISDSLNHPITAYLALKKPSCSFGVSGWEASLSWDPGLFVTVVSISGDGLNLAGYPNFQVDCRQPVAVSGSNVAILATLRVFATAPGGLYLGPPPTPSIPGAVGPTYTAGNDPGNLIVACVEGSALALPCARIGAPDCDGSTMRPFSDWPELTKPWGVDSADVTRPTPVRARMPELSPSLNDTTLLSTLERADLCCYATVVEAESRCFNHSSGGGRPKRESGALLHLEIARQYYGPGLSKIGVYVPNVSVEGCLQFVGIPPRPPLSMMAEGDTILVIAELNQGSYVALPFGILPMRNGTVSGFPGLSIEGRAPLESIADFARMRRLQAQNTGADVILEARCEAISYRDNCYTMQVLRTIKGVALPSSFQLPFAPTACSIAPHMPVRVAWRMTPGREYVLYLQVRGANVVTPLFGRWSVWERAGALHRNDSGAVVTISN